MLTVFSPRREEKGWRRQWLVESRQCRSSNLPGCRLWSGWSLWRGCGRISSRCRKWTTQRTSGSFLRHSCSPRDSGGPSSWYTWDVREIKHHLLHIWGRRKGSPLTNWTMMSPVGFDAAAFRTFEDDLTLLEAHLLYIFLGGITSRDSSRV